MQPYMVRELNDSLVAQEIMRNYQAVTLGRDIKRRLVRMDPQSDRRLKKGFPYFPKGLPIFNANKLRLAFSYFSARSFFSLSPSLSVPQSLPLT